MNSNTKIISRLLLSSLLIIIGGCSSNKLIKSEHNPYIFRESLTRQDVGKKVTITGKNQTIWVGKIISFDENSITIDRDKNNEQKNIQYDRIQKIVITDDNFNLAIVFSVLIGAAIILIVF